jgi:hypothetical protein
MAGDPVQRLLLRIGPPDHGWVSIQLTVPGVDLRFVASSIPNDSIGDLAQAASALVVGLLDQNVIWNTEPEIYGFSFRGTGQQVQFVIQRFPDARRRTPGLPVAAVNSNAETIARTVWRTLRRLQGTVPAEEYARSWGHPFPNETVERLGAALRRSPN